MLTVRNIGAFANDFMICRTYVTSVCFVARVQAILLFDLVVTLVLLLVVLLTFGERLASYEYWKKLRSNIFM